MKNKLLCLLTPFLLAAGLSVAKAQTAADVSIINRSTGETLPLYRHHGRLYVEGRPGDRYAVHLRNRTDGRILTVLSVDGVNAVTGQTASYGQSGYVLSPRGAAEIAGWRKDMSDVAAFYFTSLGDSYAARTSRPDNVGVIGVAVFKEYVPPPRVTNSEPPYAGAGAASDAVASRRAMPSAAASPKAEEKIGTGHGERVYAPTSRTEFERASSTPSEIISIYYDTRANLIAQGVIPRTPPRPRLPDAFPQGGFVPDPA